MFSWAAKHPAVVANQVFLPSTLASLVTTVLIGGYGLSAPGKMVKPVRGHRCPTGNFTDVLVSTLRESVLANVFYGYAAGDGF